MTSQRQRNHAENWRRRISDRLRKARTPAATAHVWWDELRRVATDPEDQTWQEIADLLKRAAERSKQHTA
jgi:hypothetical protein